MNRRQTLESILWGDDLKERRRLGNWASFASALIFLALWSALWIYTLYKWLG